MMRIFQIIPAPEWAAIYIDESQVAPLSPWQAEEDRPPETLPLARRPLVCWAYLEDPRGSQELLPDGTTRPHHVLSGMEAVIGPDGDAQVAPSGGDLFVGYLHESQPLSTLAAHAELVWGVYSAQPRTGRHQADDGVP
jgi:hypothetical protein